MSALKNVAPVSCSLSLCYRSTGECNNVSSIFVQMQVLLALICYEMIIALPQWSVGILSYNLQLFLLVIANSHGYLSIPVVAIYDCVNLPFIFQQNKSNNNQLAWPSPVVFADIYRSVSVLSFNREFLQTLAADHCAQMVCVIVWRCEVTHRAAETLRRRSSLVHPEMTHVLPGAIASLSPKTHPPPPTPSYPHSSPSFILDSLVWFFFFLSQILISLSNEWTDVCESCP